MRNGIYLTSKKERGSDCPLFFCPKNLKILSRLPC
nr:MAG TPA: hypothetical protein [Caudoviricetes sp.]